MGAIAPSKMPKGKTIKRTDKPEDVMAYAKGGKVMPPGKFVKGAFPWEEGRGKNFGTLKAKGVKKAGKVPPSKTLRK
jgi:hypothetical protein